MIPRGAVLVVGGLVVELRREHFPADRTVHGEVVVGRLPGRTAPDQITLFKSLGIAIEDLAAAHYVNEQAAARGIGVVLELGGLRHATEN